MYLAVTVLQHSCTDTAVYRSGHGDMRVGYVDTGIRRVGHADTQAALCNPLIM